MSTKDLDIMLIVAWGALWLITALSAFYMLPADILKYDIVIYPLGTLVLGALFASAIFTALPFAKEILGQERRATYGQFGGHLFVFLSVGMMFVPLLHISNPEWVGRYFWLEQSAAAIVGFRIPILIHLLIHKDKTI